MKSFESLLGLQCVTALSAQRVLGIDGVFYRADKDGLHELTDADMLVIEDTIVVNRFEPPLMVEFRRASHEETLFYGVDEQHTGLVIVELGTHLIERQKWMPAGRDANGGRYDSEYRTVREPALRFHYNLKGYTPTWLPDPEEITLVDQPVDKPEG